jgi:dTDP-4-amino-4,6-dideoxygalactose transaminase
VTKDGDAIVRSPYLEGTGEERAWRQATCHGRHPAVPWFSGQFSVRYLQVHSAAVTIPLTDVKAQCLPLLDEIRRTIDGVLEAGQFILGPNVRCFEQEAAAYLGVTDTIGVANGTDALVLVLDALGIAPGDEVVCPSFTFYATAESIARRGARPVFADIDPQTLNLDPEDVAARVTARTKAVLAVHLYGRPARLAELSATLPLIEDAAQAFGAVAGSGRVGSLGRAGTFSFYPTKNLFGLGDGGLVSTNDAELADRLRLLRFHGSRDKERFDAVGYNSRLDEVQAAVLRIFLRRVDEWN